MTRPVTVGLDGSPGSRAAAEWAAREAVLRGLPLKIVHVWEPAPELVGQAQLLGWETHPYWTERVPRESADGIRLRHVDDIFRGQVVTLVSNAFNIARLAQRADLLIGAVLVAGARAPILVPESTIKTMKEGSVIVDVAVDQGGCVETMHPTTLADPIYVVHGVVHYGVANMPALVPRTSTFALTNATLPYVVELAGKGLKQALRENTALAKGLNVCRSLIVHRGVAESVGEQAASVESCLEQ